ncbi:MAG: adenosylcobinamide-GDP ribazoletransferase [Calditerrivibrio sp.]|nr:adenosylcobinamide-GDP ribazoletransferase [Calditerrivibrio sp.]
MKGFLTALTFLTILKINLKNYDSRSAVYFFPIVGLLITIPVYYILKAEIYSKELIAIIYHILITGGLHLDGLADTSDALFSHRDRVKKLEIMKDSRIGVFGALALVIAILFRYDIYTHIQPISVILAGIYSRFGALIIMKALPYAREEGTGAFFKDINLSDFKIVFTVLPFICMMLLTFYQFIYISIFFLITTILFLAIYKKSINGWTGDMIGGYMESSELILMYSLLYFC